MKSLVCILILALSPFAFADDYDLSAGEIVQEIAWRFEHQTSPDELKSTLWATRILADLVQDNLDSRLELKAAVHSDPRLFLDLLHLAEQSEACKTDDVRFVISSAMDRSDIAMILSEVQKPELSAQAVLNLLPIFRDWYIHEHTLANQIHATLNLIEVSYRNDGYVFGLRVGNRVHTDSEQNAVVQMIQVIRAKNLAKKT